MNPAGRCALLVGAVMLLASVAIDAQPAKIWRIAVLTGDRPGAVDALVEGLRELNYIQDKNFVLETRHYTQDRMEAVAAEVVRLHPDVVVVGGANPAKAVNALTKTIPIVMAASSDAVAQGVIASLAHPGGNVTGFTDIAADLTAKRIGLLKEITPQAARVAVLGCPSYVQGDYSTAGEWSNVQPVAQQAGLTFVPVFIRKSDELSEAFALAARQKLDAVLVLECGILPRAEVVISLVNGARIPAIYPSPRYASAGGLMAYGPDTLDQYRRVAMFVDKILKGANPANLPVEQPAKLVFAINLKTAKALGLSIPQPLLLRADEVIQ